jgi:hypothetical protein
VNQYESGLLVGLLPFYFAAFGLYHFMVFAVNQHLPAAEKLPHSMFWSGWNRVKDTYRRFYPHSIVYQVSVACAAITLVIAISFVVLRVYEYSHG